MSQKINAKRFSKVFRDMARVPSLAATAIAKDIKKEIERNFDRGVDPYGRAWRRLAKSTLERGRHPPPLTDTREGRESITVQPTQGAGIRLTVGLLRMIYHQFGGKSHLRGHRKNKNFGRDKDRSSGRDNPPKRSFLPFEKLPAVYGMIFKKRYQEATRRVLRGK